MLNFKTKDQKFLRTLSIFTLIPLVPKKCGLSISFYEFVRGRMIECLTLTYKPCHVLTKILYVSLLITDYLIGLVFWAFPIEFWYVVWSGIEREQIRH